MPSLNNLLTIKPQYEHNQLDIISFMQQFYQLEKDDLRKMTWLYKKSGINKRYSVLPDFTESNDCKLFNTSSAIEISIDERLKVYDTEALALSKKLLSLYDKELLNKVTHLITISCTGISAPGLELKLQKQLLPNANQRAINFMGCYAAIHGLKQAHEITATYPDAVVLVVDIELCTLHFQYSTKPDLMNSAMIFGDGAAAWIIAGDKSGLSNSKDLQVIGSFSKVLHNEDDKMAWYPTTTGFIMQLSSYIPEIIGNNIEDLVSSALNFYKITDRKDISYCIHPGGLRILDNIKKSLALSDDDLISSYEILGEYGNMSSPTVMYVLERMIAKNRIPKGNKVLLMAFGPGLSIETFLFQA